MTTRDADLILQAIGNVREDLAELKVEVAAVKLEAVKTNGRLRSLELWRHGLEAVTRANAWVRPAVVAFLSGAGLAVLAVFIQGGGI